MTAEDSERLGFVTLAQFLRQLPALSVLHDGGNGDERLRWVEPSELDDPTPYLLDGEFLLTAGLPFVGDGGGEEPVDAYVRRLVEARVGALGFGLEPYFESVPAAVVRACRQHNLTLVAIPGNIPFAALGLEFSRLLESDNAKTFRQLADTNRQLMRAVLSSRPEHELLAALVQRVPVWAVLVGADGRVRARGPGTSRGPHAAGSAGAAPGVDPAVLQPLLARLLAGSGPRVEMDSFDAAGSSLVFGYPLRSTRDANLGALVLGTDAPLTPAQNSVVSTAVGLLELLVRQRTSGSLAPSQLATALLLHPESVATGPARQVNGLKDLLAQSISSTRSGQLRVVQGIRVDAAAGTDRAASGQRHTGEGPVRELLEWRRLFDTKLVEHHRLRLCRHYPAEGRRRPARRGGAARLAPGDRQRHRIRVPGGCLPARLLIAQPGADQPPERPGRGRHLVRGGPAGLRGRHHAGGPPAGPPARARAGAARYPAGCPAGMAWRERQLGCHGEVHRAASQQRPPADRRHR